MDARAAHARRDPTDLSDAEWLDEAPRGFRVIPRRGVVERILAGLSRSRWLARDYKRLPESGLPESGLPKTGKTTVHAVMARMALRRIVA